MMKPTQNLVKCSLLLQVNDPENFLEFSVYPEHMVVEHQGVKEYIFQFDLTKINNIKVEVTKHNGLVSKLIIEQIKINDVPLSHINSFSFFKSTTGEIKKTHGYIDGTGVYQIKLHSNIISQNYIGYLLDLTK